MLHIVRSATPPGEDDVLRAMFAARKSVFVDMQMVPYGQSGHRILALVPSQSDAELMGGEPLDAPRHMWWNFVSSSQERIEQAKQDWREGRFGQVPGETEFIPLPER